jgi:serine phosphatase RsbU (regulator of sigma subunit)
VIHERLDRVVAAEFAETFVTGQIARLAVRTGRLSWVNAGHPAPLLVRAGRVERALACRPSLPWGLGGHVEEEAHEQLEVGDAVLWHTDGVTEGRSPAGEALGGERLVGLVERAARSQGPPGPILRQLIHEVLDYQGHRLRDDATMLWVTWNGPN